MAPSAYDEMKLPDGAHRSHYRRYGTWLQRRAPDRLARRRAEADSLFHRVGITFAVYGEYEGAERLIPFDIVPRILLAAEWRVLEDGLRQRVRALNAFLNDVYHDQDILRARRIPAELILCNAQYRPEMQGIDVVRAGDGEFHVLEDKLRVPSGVSYMPENRKMMTRLFPELFARHSVAPVEQYPGRAPREPALGGARGRHRSDRGPADRGRAQQRLLRARIPRAADGCRARRGPRPVRP